MPALLHRTDPRPAGDERIARALAERDYVEAVNLVQVGDEAWTEERFERALAPFYAEHERIVFDQTARYTDKTQIEEQAQHVYRARQILVDASGDNQWYLEAEIDVRNGMPTDQPLLKLLNLAG